MKQTTSGRLVRCAARAFGFAGFFFPAFVILAGPPPLWTGWPEASKTNLTAFAWDAEFKEYTARPGERYAQFSFWFTNVSPQEVVIRGAKSSCFCTVAKLPEQPWSIGPGKSGSIEVTLDLLVKGGTVSKAVTVDTSVGHKTLLVQARVTPATGHEPVPTASGAYSDGGERSRNRETALADRQAVFKRKECASCHADPAKGKADGAEIYAAVCANCHESPQRASMVPDLRGPRHLTGSEHWRKWITQGRAGSMMPAFARIEGGPLDDLQIEALVDHLVKTIPIQPRPEQHLDPRAYAETMSAFPLPSAKGP